MTSPRQWEMAGDQLRDPMQIISLSFEAPIWDVALLEAEVRGPFWERLSELAITLLVTREYEHLVVALSCGGAGPSTSVLRVPHPSGLVADRDNNVVHIACTRNPNQLMQLEPVAGFLRRADRHNAKEVDHPGGLVPTATKFGPGCLYLHDIALIGGRLVGNAVGLNAIVDLADYSLLWWPASIDKEAGPDTSQNLIQLNSIAASATLEESYFTASTAAPGQHAPGHPDWPVDRQGVILSGASREPVVRGLTRPHSARFDSTGALWVDDSGYGTLNKVDGDRATQVAGFDGWTRGLCLIDRFAVVGTSRVIPRFAQYAPGLDVSRSRCGVHIVDASTGRVEASLVWPNGDQIFAIDWLPSSVTTGFLAGTPSRDVSSIDDDWYRYAPAGSNLGPLTQ